MNNQKKLTTQNIPYTYKKQESLDTAIIMVVIVVTVAAARLNTYPRPRLKMGSSFANSPAREERIGANRIQTVRIHNYLSARSDYS